MQITHDKLCWQEMEEERREVLAAWVTGQEVDLEEAIQYHQSLPAKSNFGTRLAKAKAEGRTLAQPRAGVAELASHLELLLYLQNEGGADLLPTTIDSYTRQNRYEEAEKGLEESVREGRSLLNGFPAVNHGVANCRRLVESLSVPVQVRHGTPDARLLAEITLASGFSAFEGGAGSLTIFPTPNGYLLRKASGIGSMSIVWQATIKNRALTLIASLRAPDRYVGHPLYFPQCRGNRSYPRR